MAKPGDTLVTKFGTRMTVMYAWSRWVVLSNSIDRRVWMPRGVFQYHLNTGSFEPLVLPILDREFHG
jgi:hypothetical protein